MSSTGANRESEGGTMKNVIDDPATQPHVYNDDNQNQKSHPQMSQGNEQHSSNQSASHHGQSDHSTLPK